MMNRTLSAVVSLFLALSPAAAKTVTVGNIDLAAAPFTFSPTGGVSFTFSYAPQYFFDLDPVSITTVGTAAVSSFGGFLGIPLSPSTFFTRANILSGPDLFTQFASYPTATVIPYSISPGDLALRYTVGQDNFYGIARFEGPQLDLLRFETVADVAVTAAVPEPSTWAMLIVGMAGLGFVARRARRARESVIA